VKADENDINEENNINDENDINDENNNMDENNVDDGNLVKENKNNEENYIDKVNENDIDEVNTGDTQSHRCNIILNKMTPKLHLLVIGTYIDRFNNEIGFVTQQHPPPGNYHNWKRATTTKYRCTFRWKVN